MKRYFYIKTSLLAFGATTAIVVPLAMTQTANILLTSNVRAIQTTELHTDDLIEIGFCAYTYSSNVNDSYLSLTLDNSHFKVTDMVWSNASSSIATINCNFQALIDYLNEQYPVTGQTTTWTFQSRDVLTNFFINASNTRATWTGELHWPGFDIPASLFNVYYTNIDTYNWVTVYIADNCRNIGASAFQGNEQLVTVHIPETITTIGSYAFANCIRLSDFQTKATELFYSNLQTIGDHAFFQDQRLSHVFIRGNTLSIGDYAFYTDEYFSVFDRNIDIYPQNSIGSLGVSLFGMGDAHGRKVNLEFGLRALQTSTLDAINQPMTGTPFDGAEYSSVEVPFGSENVYKSYANWSNPFSNSKTVKARYIDVDRVDPNWMGEIQYDSSTGYNSGTPLLRIKVSPFGFTNDTVDASNAVATVLENTGKENMDDESQVDGATFSFWDDGFILAMNPGISYFATGTGSNKAWMKFQYTSVIDGEIKIFYAYRPLFVYSTSSFQIPDSMSLYMNNNKTGDPIAAGGTGHIDLNVDAHELNYMDDQRFTMHYAFSHGADTNVEQLGQLVSYKNDEENRGLISIYDPSENSFNICNMTASGDYVVTWVIGAWGDINTTFTLELHIHMRQDPIELQIEDYKRQFLATTTTTTTGYGVVDSVFRVRSSVPRGDINVNWEITPGSSGAPPEGLYIKQHDDEVEPLNFPGTPNEWQQIVGGTLWWRDDEVTDQNEKIFKVKCTTIKNYDGGYWDETDDLKLFVINANLGDHNLVKINTSEFIGGNIIFATQNVAQQFNIQWDLDSALGPISDELGFYVRLVDRYGLYPFGVSLDSTTSVLTINTSSPQGLYIVTIDGRSANFPEIALLPLDLYIFVSGSGRTYESLPAIMWCVVGVSSAIVVGTSILFARHLVSKRWKN